MKLSRKADYALRILITLAARFGESPISLSELARMNDAPKRFLEHIVLDLKSQGWIESSPGRKGGYVLAQPPEQITMGQVIRFFDGVIAPSPCVSTSAHRPCSQARLCRFRRVLLEIRNFASRYLDNMTLARLIELDPVEDHEVFALELASGDGI
ncbi:RrF2 family transcriptional regulator [Planctopirus hydrillae]|uniref:Rrf2 family transcriptional regulator n=1 Tax=Planctopirus hydrillae TaxID=1841610 RepID=A0A1C3ELR5_9PLAN|nr:Rrf2 family transcriptional regulator [Planctopirus hydrillae]ODA34174.1 Rrf2 family transcriptional regulator [Planctopirus hydrillae]